MRVSVLRLFCILGCFNSDGLLLELGTVEIRDSRTKWKLGATMLFSAFSSFQLRLKVPEGCSTTGLWVWGFVLGSGMAQH